MPPDEAALAAIIASAVEAMVSPLYTRMAALEKAQPPVSDGHALDLEAMRKAIEEETGPLYTRLFSLEKTLPLLKGEPGPVGPMGPSGPAGPAGIGERGDVGPMGPAGPAGESIRGEIGLMGPHGMDGTSVTVADVLPLLTAEMHKAIAALPPAKDGRDGASVSPVLVKAMVDEAVAALPAAKDGAPGLRGVDGIAGPPGPAGPEGPIGVGRPGEKGLDGRDGVGVAGALLNQDGHLVLTLSDGTVRPLGPVVGRDGAKGEPGAAGAPGRDGTLEQLTIKQIDDRTIEFWRKDGPIEGGRVSWDLMLFRKSFEPGRRYVVGDVVVSKGSSYVALEATTDRPNEATPSKSWALVAARGRDGTKGDPGKMGAEGPAGKDLTMLGRDGTKW